MTTYSYTKYIDDDRLALEIRNSGITIALDSVVITGEESVNVIFKADLPVPDKAILDDLISSHINRPITVRDSVELFGIDITSNVEKAMKVAITKLEGSSTQKISHDFCDATTWYTESIRVTSETLSVSGAGNILFTSNHENWIDLVSGKVPYEDRVAADYSAVIRVDGAIVTEGFTINYSNGEVSFSQSKSGSTITADYSYADKSTWKISPDTSKILKILGTTVKFTSDVNLGVGQSINFQLYVSGIPYGNSSIYKNVKDLIKCTTSISPSSMAGFGDVSQNVNFLPFDYTTSKDLKSSLMMEVRIWLSNHEPCSGEFGIVTANCLSLSE